jgi:hypothetical protein
MLMFDKQTNRHRGKSFDSLMALTRATFASPDR